MSKDEREAAINQKIEEMRKKNASIALRYQVKDSTKYFLYILILTFHVTISRKSKMIKRMPKILV